MEKKQHPLQVWWNLEKQDINPFCRFCYFSGMKKSTQKDLKKHSKLYFRVTCNGKTKNQFELSLKGSTKALDQIGIEKVLRKRIR